MVLLQATILHCLTKLTLTIIFKTAEIFKEGLQSILHVTSALNKTTVKVAADWASDSTHFNRLKVDFRKDYFQLFLRYFSLQLSVIMSNTTYLFTADGKLRKHARL